MQTDVAAHVVATCDALKTVGPYLKQVQGPGMGGNPLNKGVRIFGGMDGYTEPEQLAPEARTTGLASSLHAVGAFVHAVGQSVCDIRAPASSVAPKSTLQVARCRWKCTAKGC